MKWDAIDYLCTENFVKSDYPYMKKLIIPRLELGTFCVLDRCDNHYTIQSL